MQITGAQAILSCLQEQGVHKVFGYPGGAILPFYDALLQYPDIEHILTVHEQGAVHAADAYARASGGVGVCVATSGPGATNLVTGIANAFLDSIPMVIITGQVPTFMIGGDVFQEVDITGITMPITKHTFLVKKPGQLVETIRLAFEIAQSDRPGPVLVDIPRNVQTAFVEYTAQQPAPIKRQHPESEALKKAVQMLAASKRPLILVGGGAVNANANALLQQLVEKTQIPVASSLMGISAVDGYSEYYLGMSGLHGQEAANRAIAMSDVMLVIGCRFNDRVTGNKGLYAQDKKIIHLDIDYSELDKNINATLGIVGELTDSLEYILEHLEYEPIDMWWECIRNWEAEAKDKVHATQVYFMLLSEMIKDENVIVCTDVGQHQMWTAQNVKVNKPRSFITSGGLGAMGFGIPAAMGAAFARPDAKVVCISGDGGFKMTSQELYTIARYNLPVISVVVNNSGLGMIRQLQTVMFDKSFSQCELPAPFDFQKYAEVFGIKGYKAQSHAQFEEVFKQALAAGKPCIVEVVIDPKDMVIPMVQPGQALNAFVDFD